MSCRWLAVAFWALLLMACNPSLSGSPCVVDEDCARAQYCAPERRCRAGARTGRDGGPTDAGSVALVAPHSGSRTVSGGASSRSAHYRVIMTTGSTPGGTSSSSSQHTLRGGVVGATQGEEVPR